jgi:polysaccharide export outer membrane protein
MLRQMIIAAAALALFAVASNAAGADPPTGVPQPAKRAGIGASPAGADVQYRIGPDDTLEVVVFQVPELSRTVQVDAAGQVSLPLVGRIDAAGRTAEEVGALLTERLAGRYLRDPVITVLVKQAVSQRVTVDGAVVKPGIYSLTGPTTLLQALALANGPDPRVANLRKVAIFRSVDGARQGQVFDLAKIRDGKAPDPPVRSDDIIVVDASGARSFFTYFGNSLPLLSLFSRF